MPHYFFNVFDGQGLIDTDGVELADPNAARVFAIRYAGEVLQADAARIKPYSDWRLEVKDEASRIILCLDFRVTPSPLLDRHYCKSHGQACND